MKTYFFADDRVLKDSTDIIGITYLHNVAAFANNPSRYIPVTYQRFMVWNKVQKENDAWWIATQPYSKLIKLMNLLGHELTEFEVLIPKEKHPLIFRKDDVAIIVAPFLGLNREVNSLVETKEASKP